MVAAPLLARCVIDAALHQVDQHRRKAALDDVAADHPDDGTAGRRAATMRAATSASSGLSKAGGGVAGEDEIVQRHQVLAAHNRVGADAREVNGWVGHRFLG